MPGDCCYSVIQAVVYHPGNTDVKAFFEHVLSEYSDKYKDDVKDVSVEFKIIQTNDEAQSFEPTPEYTHRLERVKPFIYTAQIDLEQQPE